MKRWIIGVLLIAGGLFVGGRSFISRHGEAYVKEVLDAYNRARRGGVRLELVSYEGGWNGAEAKVRVRGERDGAQAAVWRTPLILKFRVDYGPLLAGWHPGLIRLRNESRLSRWMRPDIARSFLRRVPGDITCRYDGRMDWWHTMHETIRLSRIDVNDPKRGERFIVEPPEIRDDFALASLRGRAELSAREITLLDTEKGERLEVLTPRLRAVIDEFNATGPIFGSLAFSVGEVRALLKGKHPGTLRFDGGGEVSLRRQSPKLATLELAFRGRALDPRACMAWDGLSSVRLQLRVSALGISGIEKLAAMQKERLAVQQELTRALGIRDDVAMQRAILALQALDDRWIDVYNTLLISGKTRLQLDEVLKGEKESRLHLDLTFTGGTLPSDPFRAMVDLTTGMDRLAAGNFDLRIDAKLLARLSPEGKLILDSMARKGLATLKEGVYHLKGSIEKGKIVINGTRYAPQELIMMILI